MQIHLFTCLPILNSFSKLLVQELSVLDMKRRKYSTEASDPSTLGLDPDDELDSSISIVENAAGENPSAGSIEAKSKHQAALECTLSPSPLLYKSAVPECTVPVPDESILRRESPLQDEMIVSPTFVHEARSDHSSKENSTAHETDIVVPVPDSSEVVLIEATPAEEDACIEISIVSLHLVFLRK